MGREYTISELREMLKELRLPYDRESAEYERVWLKRMKIYRVIRAIVVKIFGK